MISEPSGMYTMGETAIYEDFISHEFDVEKSITHSGMNSSASG